MNPVPHYGDPAREYHALRHSAALIDLSSRSRLCLLGADAQRFLNGQVTNNVKDLQVGQGCYAALVSAKGKMQSDLYIYRLENELLLDFEPGLAETVKKRLEKFIIAEDVQIVDVSTHYALLRIQGPSSPSVLAQIPWLTPPPSPLPSLQNPVNLVNPVQKITPQPVPSNLIKPIHHQGADFYLATPTLSPPPFHLFVPTALFESIFNELATAVGQRAGWQALETVRIESTIPRFGPDMDESTLAPEAGLENHAISYSKGCYIGQEVIARIRTYGQVARALRGLKLPGSPKPPAPGAKLFHHDKEVGHITSAVASPLCQMNIALGYIRREANTLGSELQVEIDAAKTPATIATLPFHPFTP